MVVCNIPGLACTAVRTASSGGLDMLKTVSPLPGKELSRWGDALPWAAPLPQGRAGAAPSASICLHHHSGLAPRCGGAPSLYSHPSASLTPDTLEEGMTKIKGPACGSPIRRPHLEPAHDSGLTPHR